MTKPGSQKQNNVTDDNHDEICLTRCELSILSMFLYFFIQLLNDSRIPIFVGISSLRMKSPPFSPTYMKSRIIRFGLKRCLVSDKKACACHWLNVVSCCLMYIYARPHAPTYGRMYSVNVLNSYFNVNLKFKINFKFDTIF